MTDPLSARVPLDSPEHGPATADDIEVAARRIGAHRWVELRLFEAVGTWSRTVPELGVRVRLGAHCAHHAWHAELWRERLPSLSGTDADGLTQPASDAVVRFAEAMIEPAAPEQTLERLVGAYRVLVPRLITAYASHRDAVSPTTDAPTVRALGFVLQDEVEDWREGEAMIQAMIATPGDARRAAEHQARLEAILVGDG